MKKMTLIILVYLLVNRTYSQTNLVPNPSFESYSTCPTTLDQLNFSTGWSSFGGSPDYFNVCNGGGLSVPKNGIGYQSPFSGSAYAGLIAYDVGGFYREIIGSQLTQSLSVGIKYFIRVRVNLAEFQPPPPQFIPCDKIGLKFSTVQFTKVNPAPINNISHVYSSTIISDTMNWTTIKGFFIADSNYKYIMVGNFFNDANTNTISLPNGVKSYFFIDDICVSTDSNICYGSTNIENITASDMFKIYPNPTSAFLFIENELLEDCHVSLRNLIGEELISSDVQSKQKMDISLFPNGIYFLEYNSKNKKGTKKIIINH